MPTSEKPHVDLHCNACLGIRRHSILYSTSRHYEEEYEDGHEYDETMHYRLAECGGCDFVSMHTTWNSSSSADPVNEQWPPKVSRRQPIWMHDLLMTENVSAPFKREFIGEIYSCLKAGNIRLTVLGVRALLEQVMLEHIQDQHSFAKNIAEFEKMGFISRVQREAILPVIEAGHASMHRGFKASKEQVEAMIDITENIIESIYIAKTRTKGLVVPQRKPKT
jgi:hypothetical protein